MAKKTHKRSIRFSEEVNTKIMKDMKDDNRTFSGVVTNICETHYKTTSQKSPSGDLGVKPDTSNK